MPLTEIDPNALPPTEQAAAPVPEETATPKSPIPDELLQVPAIAALLAGKPGALSWRVKDVRHDNPVAKAISENKSALKESGIGFYKSLSGSVGVMFNVLALHPEQIKAADKAGQLLAIAPPFETVNQEISKAGPDHEALSSPGLTTAAGAPPVNPPQSAQAPMPAAAQNATQRARLMNLKPQAPTQGAFAGQGSLLRGILKPVL